MRGARRMVWAGAVLLVAGVAALVFGGTSAAQAPPFASSTLVALTITDTADTLGVDGFTGSFGTAGTPDTSLPADNVSGDFSDPDGVLDHASMTGGPTSRTSWAAIVNQLTAQAQFAGVRFRLAGEDDFVAIGSIDAFASCGPPLLEPTAYLRVDAGQIRVLGTSAGPGTTTLDVTGDQLGLDTFETGMLTVTVTIIEETTPPASAAARLEVSISGSFQDASGNTVYEAPVFDTTVGDVAVECLTDTPTESPSPSVSPTTPSPPVSPSPTASPTPSPSPTPTPTPTASTTPTATPTATPSEQPTPGPTTPGPGPASPRTPAPPGPPPAPDGTSLPATGLSLPAWWGAVSVLAGVALVLAGGWRTRSRRHPG